MEEPLGTMCASRRPTACVVTGSESAERPKLEGSNSADEWDHQTVTADPVMFTNFAGDSRTVSGGNSSRSALTFSPSCTRKPAPAGIPNYHAWSLLRREVNPLQSHRRPANDPPHTITEGETP